MRLVGQLASLLDPAALPSWLATTTQRECGRVQRAARNQKALRHSPEIPDIMTGAAESELLRAERYAALREAFTRLPSGSQQLIALLIQDPPMPYAEISAKLGIPAGSIGPSRSRCLDKLRRDPAITALINAETSNAGVDIDVQPTGRS